MNERFAAGFILQLINAMAEQLAMAQLQGHGKQSGVPGVPLCGSRPGAIVLKDLSELTGQQCL